MQQEGGRVLSAIFTSTDAGVVRRVRAGRKEDFGILVERHFGLAHAIAFAHTGNYADAEEIAQESFLRAFASLDSLREAGRFRAWLAVIARNLSLARIRSARREAPLTDAPEPALEGDAAAAELHALLWDCIEGLDDASREIVVLHYFQHMKLRDAARTLEISPAAAAKRLQRAREALGAALLRRLERRPISTRPHQRARRATIAAIAGSAAAWEASAMAGAGIGLGAMGAAAAALMIAGAGIYVALPDLYTVEPALPATESPQAPAPAVPDLTSATENDDAEPEPLKSPTLTTPDGPGTLIVSTLLPNGAPAAGMTLRVERINWTMDEPPPAVPVAEDFVLDEEGAFTLNGLPYGEYATLVTGDGFVDIDNFTLSEDFTTARESLQPLPSAPLEGTVTWPDGSPAAGAWVYVNSRESDYEENVSHLNAVGLRQQTDAEGRFRAPQAWPGVYRLFAFASDGARGLSELAHSSEPYAITVEPPGALQGRVTFKDSGAPAPAVGVTLKGKSWRDKRTATSGTDGRFEQSGLRPGEYRVAVEDVALVGEVDIVTIRSGETADASLEAAHGAIIAGRVYDQTTGLGIAGVFLSLRIGEGYEQRTTDAAGSFFIGPLAGGAAAAKLENLNAPGGLYYVAPETRLRSVAMSPTGETEFDIPLLPAAPINGRVTSEGGAPPSDVRVMLAQPTLSRLESAEAASNGSFKLGAVPGHAAEIWASAADRYSQRFHAPEVGADGIRDIDLPLTFLADGRLRGTISTADGGSMPGLAGGDVRFKPVDPAYPQMRDARLYNGHSFEQTTMIPGDYDVEVVSDYMQPIPGIAPSRITVLPGGEWTSVALVAGGESEVHRIIGQVVDPDGEPVSGARIQASGPNSIETQSSNRQGRFTLSVLGEVQLYLQVSHPDYSSMTLPAVAGEGELLITLPPRMAVGGVVRDAVTRAPIPAFTIRHRDSQEFRDSGGRFLLSKLDTAAAELVFTAPGYAATTVPRPHATGPATPEIEVLMPPAVPYQGVVVDAVGRPVASAEIHLSDSIVFNESDVPDALTDSEGGFTLDNPGSGEQTVFIAHPGFTVYKGTILGGGADAQRFVLDEGGTIDCTITLTGATAGWRPEMNLRDSDHQSRPLEIIEALDAAGGRVFRASLRNASPDAEILECLLRSEAYAELYYRYDFPVAVESGRTTSVVETLAIPTASLEVFVTREGQPVNSALPSYSQTTGDTAVVVGAFERGKGLYEFPVLPHGVGSLSVTSNIGDRQDYWSAEIRLGPGEHGSTDVELSPPPPPDPEFDYPTP